VISGVALVAPSGCQPGSQHGTGSTDCYSGLRDITFDNIYDFSVSYHFTTCDSSQTISSGTIQPNTMKTESCPGGIECKDIYSYYDCSGSGTDGGTPPDGDSDDGISGLTFKQIAEMTAPAVARHSCGGQEEVCFDSSCKSLDFLLNEGVISKSKANSIAEESRDFWIGCSLVFLQNPLLQKACTSITINLINTDKIQDFGICIQEEEDEAFCVGFANDLMKKLKINFGCQSNTILFFVILFGLFMLLIGLTK